jgi:hypothetical protein
MTTRADLARLRLAAQRIVGPGFGSAAEAVGWLTALQAQDFPGAVTSVALRTGPRSRDGVLAALDAGQVVRSWPMRGTLHFVLAEDLPWLLELTAPRALAQAARRQAELGLDQATLTRAGELALEALSGRRGLSRAGLLALWERAGVSTAGQRGYHLIGHLAHHGTLCFGPMKDGEQQLVLLAEWAPAARRPEREAARGEVALRYFRSHGPATVKDFTRWTKLLAPDIRSALAQARPELTAIEVDGVQYLMDPATPERLADRATRRQARDVLLLPGFDEYMLGYGDRTAALPAEFADRIVPGGNGMFRGTVVSDGQVVGTWNRSGRGGGKGAERAIQATPLTGFEPAVEKAIARVYADLP